MKIMVTGGAGYIGSHTCVELLNENHEIVVVDNLCNSKEEALRRIKKITGKSFAFHKIDLRDRDALKEVFQETDFDAVIHFAALKAVGESVDIPLTYYHNNLTGTLTLCQLMAESGVKKLVFSSSATVYGDPATVPVLETFPIAPTNPYGHTKAMIEQILSDLNASDSTWDIALLRYFNPIGAHPSGLIGEDPDGIPNNLFPYITQVAIGKLARVNIFGDDYPTPDGTGIRDYIHVVDLAKGHLKALKKLSQHPGLVTYNLGTGRGYSVFEAIRTFEQASGKPIPYNIVKRRPGDVPISYADPHKAQAEMGWHAEYDLTKMCEDAWRWQSRNPQGFLEE